MKAAVRTEDAKDISTTVDCCPLTNEIAWIMEPGRHSAKSSIPFMKSISVTGSWLWQGVEGSVRRGAKGSCEERRGKG